MRHHLRRALAATFSLCVTAASSSAHHSFPTEFDAKKCSETIGTLTKVDWQNPHAYFWVDAKNARGETESLTFQISSPSNLRRGGTNRQDFIDNFGKTVTVRGCASRNGTTNRFAASMIKLPDGSVHRVGQDVEGIFGTKEY